MKRLFSLLGCLLIFLGGCSSHISESFEISSSDTATKSLTESQTVNSMGSQVSSSLTSSPSSSNTSSDKYYVADSLYEEMAKGIYSQQYLYPLQLKGEIATYHLNGCILLSTSSDKQYQKFKIYYDVKTTGPDNLFGLQDNGVLQDDGWITDKYAYVTLLHKKDGQILLDSQSVKDDSDSVSSASPESFDIPMSDRIKFTEIAKNLYKEYLDEHVANKDLTSYHIKAITLNAIKPLGFQFAVTYDLCVPDNPHTGNGFGCAGNGLPHDDGWITNKYAMVNVTKVNEVYRIESQGTG